MIVPGRDDARRVALARAIPELTPAELRVCLLILERQSTRSIAETLGLSERTIQNQRLSIRRKIGAQGSLEVELLRIAG